MLNPLAEYVIHWRWLPVAPEKQDLKQSFTSFGAPEMWPELPRDESTMESFRANFSSIAERTPDPLLYALVKVFNTPLLNVPLRDAYQRNFSFWDEVTYREQDKQSHAHLWTMSPAIGTTMQPEAGSLIITEYRFDGSIWLHSNCKSLEYMKEAYADLAKRIGDA